MRRVQAFELALSQWIRLILRAVPTPDLSATRPWSSKLSGQWLLKSNARTMRCILIDEDYAGGLQRALEASHGLRGPSNYGAGCLKALNSDDP